MRERLKSRSVVSILAKAQQLIRGGGVREIILIAQDSTAYGTDNGLRHGLARLLTRVCEETAGLDWLRVLYLYPAMIRPPLLKVYAQQERLCTYFDMPMQHVSDRLLRTLKRGYTQRRLVSRLPSQAPDIDGVVYMDGAAASGDLVEVERVAAKAYDLTARLIPPSSAAVG
ncbi:tRNA-2-methylthio-N(6)-dimethylallyladenosine synthase [Candidatus Entotheonellaceae bacterium PAL068K]